MTFLTQWSQGVRLLSAPKRKWTETDVLLRLGLGTVTSHHVCITELHATTELQESRTGNGHFTSGQSKHQRVKEIVAICNLP